MYCRAGRHRYLSLWEFDEGCPVCAGSSASAEAMLRLKERFNSQLNATIEPWLDRNSDQSIADDYLKDSWRFVLETILAFDASSFLLPEEQVRSNFWSKLFHGFMIHRISDIVFGGPEFDMGNIPSYGANCRVDYEANLRRLVRDGPIMIFLSESCVLRLNINDVHKDLWKIAVELLGSLLNNMSLCSNAVEVGQHIIFGVLTSGVQIRFCCLSATHSLENGWTFVFQAPDHWFVDLADPNYTIPCGPCVCCSSDAAWRSTVDVSVGSTHPENEVIGGQVDFGTTSDRLEKWPNTFPAEANYYAPRTLTAEQLIPRLKILFNFFDTVVNLAVQLDDRYLDGPNQPNSQFKIADRLRPYIPKSGSSSASQPEPRTPGPSGSIRTQPGRWLSNVFGATALQYAIKHRLIIGGPYSGNSKVTVVPVINAKNGPVSALVFKPYVEMELKCLRQLSRVPNIIRLFDFEKIQDPPAYVIYHEEFVSMEFPKFSCLSQAFRFLAATMVDAFSALAALKKHKIVHRDITPHNFMYSWQQGVWKLCDFNLAIT
jgi:hypothetical protein